MPVTSAQTLAIACDNPNCPGHPELDPAVRDGWLFTQIEAYGAPPVSYVYGSAACYDAHALIAGSGAEDALREVNESAAELALAAAPPDDDAEPEPEPEPKAKPRAKR